MKNSYKKKLLCRITYAVYIPIPYTYLLYNRTVLNMQYFKVITFLPLIILITYTTCSMLSIERELNMLPLNNVESIYIQNFLSLYHDFDLIIHTDNVSLDAANYFLDCIKDLIKSYTFFNYDRNVTDNLIRPHHYRFINLVILKNNTRFLNYTNNFNVNLNDVIIFCLSKRDYRNVENNKTFYEMNSLKYAGNVLFVFFLKNQVKIYKKCYYCGNESMKLTYLETANNETVNIDKWDLLPNNFTNFNGHYFRVAYLDYFPYMFCEHHKWKLINNVMYKICTNEVGSEAMLLNELSRKLNFKFYLISSGYQSNISYLYVFQRVLKKDVDFAIGGITKTVHNTQESTFTKSIRFENYVFLFKCTTSILKKLFYFLYPFDIVLWIFVFVTIITITLCLYGFVKIAKESDITIVKSFFVCLRCFLEQTTHMSTNLFSFRTRFSQYLMLTILGFACIEIDIAYKSKLSSIIIRPPYTEPQDLEDLLEDDYVIIIQAIQNNTVWDKLFSNDALVERAKKSTLLFNANVCEIIDYLLRNKAAMLNEYTVAQYNSQYVCSNFFNDTGIIELIQDLRIAKIPLRSVQHGWALEKGSPYYKSFNKIFGWCENGGLMSKWKDDAVFTLKTLRIIQQSDDGVLEPTKKSVSLESYKSCFFLYFIGNLFATICFLIELTCRYFTRCLPICYKSTQYTN